MMKYMMSTEFPKELATLYRNKDTRTTVFATDMRGKVQRAVANASGTALTATSDAPNSLPNFIQYAYTGDNYYFGTGSGTAPALPGITDFSGVTGLAAGHPLLLKYLEAQFSDFYTYTGSGSASVTAPDDPQYMFDYFINTKPLNSNELTKTQLGLSDFKMNAITQLSDIKIDIKSFDKRKDW